MAHGILAATRRSKRARSWDMTSIRTRSNRRRDDHAEARRRLEAGVKYRRRLWGAQA